MKNYNYISPGVYINEHDLTLTPTYVQDTDVFVPGYASRGPIEVPVKITDITAFNIVFGTPENDAEKYMYYAVKSVLDNGGTVTALRLPYFNDTWIENAKKETSGVPYVEQYKGIYLDFVKSENDPYITADVIADAYERPEAVTPVKITTTLSNNITQDDIINIRKGQGENDAVIVNRFHNKLSQKGRELFVSVIGAGNVLYNQGLTENTSANFSSYLPSAFIGDPATAEDPIKNVVKLRNKWQYSGEFNDFNELEVAPETYVKNLVNQYPTLTTYSVDQTSGTPITVADYISNTAAGLVTKFTDYLADQDYVIIKGIPGTKEVDEETVNVEYIYFADDNSADPVTLRPLVADRSLSKFINMPPANITVADLGNVTFDETGKSTITLGGIYIYRHEIEVDEVKDHYYKVLAQSATTLDDAIEGLAELFPTVADIKVLGYKYVEGTTETDPVNIKLPVGSFLTANAESKIVGEIPSQTIEWAALSTSELDIVLTPGQFAKTFVNPLNDDFITVLVNEIVPSSSENGKFNIITVEVFNGSVDPEAMNSVSKSSDFIGDIINENSDYIYYYSRPTVDKFNIAGAGYDPETMLTVVEDELPLRLSWIPETIEVGGQNMAAYIMPESAEERGNWIDDVLNFALDKVKNKIVYTFRDCVDAGISSIYNYFGQTENSSLREYDSTNYAGNFTSSFTGWKQVANALSVFCQYKHKLSMFHIDGPRNLVIDGTLSRADDEYVPLIGASKNVIFSPKTLITLKLGNTSYSQTNVMWWECYDNFTQRRIWLPSSIKLIGDIIYNDINRNVWDAPAGQTYGVIGNAFRPAFNPDIEITDKIYAQYINYGASWPNGVMTIEGQKTNYAEQSALNRINVRRLVLYLERHVQTVAQTFVYEPNNAFTWDRLTDALDPEFQRCKTEGGLYDYLIKIDGETNTPEAIDNNELRMMILVQPTRTAEKLICDFYIAKTGVDLSEIVQGLIGGY